LSEVDLVETDCPADVVDRLLWRNAQRILHRHVVRLDGLCHWCGLLAPCGPRELAVRADAVSRMPWHESWPARNEITRMMPMATAELSQRGAWIPGQNQRSIRSHRSRK
jgi:hypothetical protein